MLDGAVADRQDLASERLDLVFVLDDASNLLATEESAEVAQEDQNGLLAGDKRAEVDVFAAQARDRERWIESHCTTHPATTGTASGFEVESRSLCVRPLMAGRAQSRARRRWLFLK